MTEISGFRTGHALCFCFSQAAHVVPRHTDSPSSQGTFARLLGPWAPHHLLIVLAVAFAVRTPIFLALDTTTVGWHSADYGSIARNYYRNGFQFFYPQVDWGGEGPGFVEMEFPIVPYATAILYKLSGGVDDRLAVVVPLASGLLAVLFTYLIALELFTPAVAVVAGLFASCSPVFARFSQLAFPEATMLAGSAMAIYAAVLWCRTGRTLHLVSSAVALSLALLLKPTALILGGPLLWVFWLREGPRLWRRPTPYLFGLIALVPPLLWYAHALGLAREFGNSFGILFGGGSSKMANWAILTTPAFYSRMAERLTVYHFTFGGVAAALWAVRARWTEPQRIVPIWLASAFVSIVVVAEGNYEGGVLPDAGRPAGVPGSGRRLREARRGPCPLVRRKAARSAGVRVGRHGDGGRRRRQRALLSAVGLCAVHVAA